MERIEAKFKSMTEGNRIIFCQYLQSLRERKITGSDIELAKRFAKYLRRHAVGPLTSWSDVFETSKRVNITYRRKPGFGCPIVQIGRALERAGAIAPRKKERSFYRSRVSLFMSEKTRELAEGYFAEITKTKNARHALFTIAVVRRWEASLLPQKSLLTATVADAESFIKAIPAERLAQAGDFIRHMRNFYDWLLVEKFVESNPFDDLERRKEKRRCSKCGIEKNFFGAGKICGKCYTEKVAPSHVERGKVWDQECERLHGYNQEIFKLYLRYIRRYRQGTVIFRDTKLFFKFLHTRAQLRVLRSWTDVATMSSEFRQFVGEASTLKQGCPFIKVAHVLQELGVIPIREEDYVFNIRAKLGGLNEGLTEALGRYTDYMRKSRRSEKTVGLNVHIVKKCNDWLKLNSGAELWTASEAMIRQYLLVSGTDLGATYQRLNRFYRWAKSERYVLSNPLENIPRINKAKSLKICSPEQVKKIEKFIKSAKSNPEHALMLALMFYWGATCKEIAFATVEFDGGGLKIIYHRGKLSYGKSQYRRDQVLQLPSAPAWVAQLQKRFRESWQGKFKDTHADLPRQPLLMHAKGKHNRPLHSLTVRKIYYEVIKRVAGARIPPSVLRRSGADHYSKQNASAILNRMGWSKAGAFNFIWMPRQYFELK